MDWNTEKNCFHTFAQECAKFYCIQHDPFLQDRSVETQPDSISADTMKDVPTGTADIGAGTCIVEETTTGCSSLAARTSSPVTLTCTQTVDNNNDVTLSSGPGQDAHIPSSGPPGSGLPGSDLPGSNSDPPGQSRRYTKRCAWQWSREHVLLPALRTRLAPPCNMATDGCVLQIADLRELYRVFERC